MFAVEKPILQNPFHPLDLSPEDLLRIYNRFEQSRQINKNPQQQLPIDTIAQLISSLKGIQPSYIQKCITQSFIKPTISWNDFLTLLDQQSQIREKILGWVLYYDQAQTKRYKLKKYLPFRSKVQKSFDFVTFMKIVTLSQEQYCIVQVDHQKMVLIDINQGNFKQIDRFQKKNSKMNLEQKDNSVQSKNNSKIVNKSKLYQPFFSNKKLGLNNSLKIQSEKLIGHSSFQTNGNLRSSEFGTTSDQEAYFKKQRKNIHSVFNVFKDLQIQDSIALANLASIKIQDRSFNAGQANSIKEVFAERVVLKAEKIKQIGSKNVLPFQRAQKKLKSLYEQKSKLSYNPYRVKKSFLPSSQDLPSILQLNQKKIIHQRKQKSYILESVATTFCADINCLGIAYHNMQIIILKVGKDLNKMAFEEQDLIRITLQRDHKKNQVIESVKFYHHTIRSRWFILILVRVEYKSEGRTNAAQSYVLGFQIKEVQNKRKGGFNYTFKCNQDSSSCFKKQTFRLIIDKFEATVLQIEPKYGIHILSFNGKYFTFREDYIENELNPVQTQYWKLKNEQKFKNSNLSLSCISIGSSINKVLFGTNNGNVILYDTFSYQFRIKKIASHAIVKVQIIGKQGFALTLDQKIIIMNLVKFEEIHSFSAVNEDKLHQKVINFQYDQKSKEILTFGSQIKVYDQQTDQSQLHKKRQMEKTYTWRLAKLKNQILPNDKLSQRIESKMASHSSVNKNSPELKSSELIITSEKYFIILSEILEVIVIDKSNLRVKFTFILNVPYDSKVMKIAISPSQKLLAVVLFNQSVYIYNIYTQELYMYLKPQRNQKFISLAFLDQKNEYLLAVGTESGKIALIPYSSVPQKPICYMKYHERAVSIVQIRSNYMISCCEGGKIGIWQLPFNVIKHEFKLAISSKFISKIVGVYSNKIIYLKSISDQIFQINLNTVKLIRLSIIGQQINAENTNVMSVDQITNQLFIVSLGSMSVFAKNSDYNQWVFKKKVKIFDAKGQKGKKKCEQASQYGQGLGIGIIGSEKAIVFYQRGGAFVYSYQNEKVGKYITFNE